MRLWVFCAEDPQNGEVLSEQVLIGFIDDILKRDDINNNGYIEYPEYITGMRSRRYTHGSVPAVGLVYVGITPVLCIWWQITFVNFFGDESLFSFCMFVLVCNSLIQMIFI